MAARWPGRVDSIGFRGADATMSATGFSWRCGASGIRIVANASLVSTAPNSRVKPPAVMTRRERDFSSAARLARSGAVTRTFSMRNTASEQLAPRRYAGLPKRPSFTGGGSDGGTGSFGSIMIRAQLVWDHWVVLTGIGRGAGGAEPRAMPSSEPPYGAAAARLADGGLNCAGLGAGAATDRGF